MAKGVVLNKKPGDERGVTGEALQQLTYINRQTFRLGQ